MSTAVGGSPLLLGASPYRMLGHWNVELRLPRRRQAQRRDDGAVRFGHVVVDPLLARPAVRAADGVAPVGPGGAGQAGAAADGEGGERAAVAVLDGDVLRRPGDVGAV